MEFGWINAAGGVIVCLLLAPNILYALKAPGGENRCENRLMNFWNRLDGTPPWR